MKSSEPADFQTVLTFLIWWRFGGVINEIQKSKDVKNKDYPWCVQAPISLLLIGQNSKVRTVLKSSESADFQNFPIFLIWWKFNEDINKLQKSKFFVDTVYYSLIYSFLGLLKQDYGP